MLRYGYSFSFRALAPGRHRSEIMVDDRALPGRFASDASNDERILSSSGSTIALQGYTIMYGTMMAVTKCA